MTKRKYTKSDGTDLVNINHKASKQLNLGSLLFAVLS